MSGMGAYFGSMAGRLFAILAAGMVAAALIAAAVTTYIGERNFERQLMERTADQLETYLRVLDAIPPQMRKALIETSAGGIQAQPEDVPAGPPDDALQQVLAERGGLVANADVRHARLDVCMPELAREPNDSAMRIWQSEEVQRALELTSAQTPRSRWGPRTRFFPPACHLVSTKLSDGSTLNISLQTRPVEREQSPWFEPAASASLAVAILILAYIAARIATAPLMRLSEAAVELGQNLDRPPVAVKGPLEVRRAAEAFNAMQERLQEHVAERTRMLAAITHDLQTPLTRLRLRMEKVEDEALRERLVADLQAMKALIDEGLDLARSADTSEALVKLDLDSLLESLVEDVADAGGAARFEGGAGAVLRVRPLAIRRLFANLIDNAVKYGGGAWVSSHHEGRDVTVRVRDRGPGLPEHMLQRVFDPFLRLEHSRSRQTGGAGLGLTIARMLAEKNGAQVGLRNHPEGGLEAIVRWQAVL